MMGEPGIALLLSETLALVLLFAASAFFSSAETALFSLNPVQLYHIRRLRPSRGAQIDHILARPRQLLASILAGNTLVNVSASAVGFSLADQLFPACGEAVAIPAMTLLLLVFGEVFPKRLALHQAEALAGAYAPALLLVNRVMTPARVVLEWTTHAFERSLRTAGDTLTEAEFRTAVSESQEKGILDKEERSMVDGIIRLEDIQASEVMTPRVDLVGVDGSDPPAAIEQAARRVRYRYLPVYRGSLDRIEGFLDVPRFLLTSPRDVRQAVVAPLFVPENVPLNRLLATFQEEGHRIACVLDEFGGTAGVVTRGDILEEIVADVDNEYGPPQPEIEPLAPNRWLVSGSASLEEINYELGLELEAEGADRMAGWVTAQTEHIPKPGEVVTAQRCRVTVRNVRRHRILDVILEVTDERAEEIP